MLKEAGYLVRMGAEWYGDSPAVIFRDTTARGRRQCRSGRNPRRERR